MYLLSYPSTIQSGGSESPAMPHVPGRPLPPVPEGMGPDEEYQEVTAGEEYIPAMWHVGFVGFLRGVQG